MPNRTKTYIAGDWDHDKEAIDKLYEWKENKMLDFDFIDAHELKQSRDTSLNCTIKRSLKERLNQSNVFVLVVGENTNTVTAGSCQYCQSYNSYIKYCARGYSVDYRSYIQYECEEAIKANMNIIVLYVADYICESFCPEFLRNKGNHVPMLKCVNWNYYVWDYVGINNAIKQANLKIFE